MTSSTTTPAPTSNATSSAATAPPRTSLTPADIEIATRAADHFTHIYYSAYDSDTRLTDLPKLYRPASSLTWNGKPFQGADGVRQLIEKMPITKHEVQSFDCHPIPGTSPPSLMVTVSGSVTHGRGPAGNPPNTPARTVDGHPRVFSQTFVLVPDPSAPPTKAGEVAKYYISADAFRFAFVPHVSHVLPSRQACVPHRFASNEKPLTIGIAMPT